MKKHLILSVVNNEEMTDRFFLFLSSNSINIDELIAMKDAEILALPGGDLHVLEVVQKLRNNRVDYS